MSKAGILLTFVTGIATSVVFQDFFRLRNNDQFPADELLANELKRTSALVTGKLRFR